MTIPQRILLHVAAGAAVVIAVATAVTYGIVYEGAKQRDLKHLETYVRERTRREEIGFKQVEINLALVRGQFLKRMESPIPRNFESQWNERFELFPDGAWRSRTNFSDGRKYSTLVIEATMALRSDAVRLQETRYQAGLINEVDVTRARTELANVEADLQGVRRRRAQIEHALAVLCGEAPANFTVAAKATRVVPPQIPAGLPSSLLQRRPDVVEAEQNLAAANARIGVAKAAFFPTIKLTGAAGFASADLGTLVDWPSRFAQFGPSITVPVFQGGRNQANLKAAEARYEQNVATYRGSVLNAFREVEDSLSDLSTLASQAEAVNRALVSARDTASLANERYQKGLSSYLDVVDAQREALKAERQDAQLRGERAVSTILLAKALGGGWERSDVPQIAATK